MPREFIGESWTSLAGRTDKLQAGHRDAEALKVGSSQAEVDLSAVAADAGDLVDQVGPDGYDARRRTERVRRRLSPVWRGPEASSASCE